MSNIEKPFANVIWNKAMPEKGEIIDIDIYGDGTSKRFRVLKVEGMIATLLSLDNIGKTKYADSTNSTIFDNNLRGISYASVYPYTGYLDNLLNDTYYNSLATNIKNAIIPVNRVQSMYDSTDESSDQADFNIKLAWSAKQYSSYTKITQKTIGNRYCWALDLDDIKEYFNLKTGDILDGYDLMEMLLNKTDRYAYIWFCTARKENPEQPTSYNAYHFYAFYSYITSYWPSEDAYDVAQPAFKIDLTNVDYITE